MKIKKNFVAILMIICLCMVSNISVLATQPTTEEKSEMTSEKASDKEVIAFMEALSEEEKNHFSNVDMNAFLKSLSKEDFEVFTTAVDAGIMPLLDEGSVTLNKSTNANPTGSFTMTNPGYWTKKTYASFDLISDSASDTAQMMITSGSKYTASYTVTRGNSPVHTDFDNGLLSTKSTMTVSYWANFIGGGNQRTMTLKCWAWTL